MSVEAVVNVYFQAGGAGDLGMRLIRATAEDGQSTPVDGATMVFTIAEGPGALGDGDEQIVMLRSDRLGRCHCYWYPVGEDAEDVVMQATVHVRSDDPRVLTLQAEIAGEAD